MADWLSFPRRFKALCSVAALVAVSSAVPGVLAKPKISIEPAATAPFELASPRDGELLRGGHESTLRWRAREPGAVDRFEEWEAFVSFDDGQTWPVRATPHLDIDVVEFRFVVPNVASEQVRLMLRFGDEEHEELGWVVPASFRSSLGENDLQTLSARPALGNGEVARPGDSGVVVWTAGDRDGRHSEVRAATLVEPTLLSTRSLPSWPITLFVGPEPSAMHLAHPSSAGDPVPTRTRQRPKPSPRPHGTSLVLLGCRRNE